MGADKITKDKVGKDTIQKKNSIGNKSFPSAPITQLCGDEGKQDDKGQASKDGSTAFSTKPSFWSPDTIQGKFKTGVKQFKSSPLFPPIQLKTNNTAPAQRVASPNNKTGLPNSLKSGIETLSGLSLDAVKVHYNSSQPAQLNAHAYAQGTDIHVAPGQEKHLPHEAWHVVQQAQGRVKPTMQMKGKVPVNDDAALENEADVMGAKAVQMFSNGDSKFIQKKAISNGVVAQLGMWSSFKNFFGFGKKNEEKAEEKLDQKKEFSSLMNGEKNKKTFGERMGLASISARNAGGDAISTTENFGDIISDSSTKVGGNIALGSGVLGAVGMVASGLGAKAGIDASMEWGGEKANESLEWGTKKAKQSSEWGEENFTELASNVENIPDQHAANAYALGAVGAKGLGEGGALGAKALGGVGALGAKALGVVGGGLSTVGGLAGGTVSAGLGIAGMATGGAIALTGNVVGKGVELAGGLAGLATTAGVGVAEVIYHINARLDDVFESIPMTQVVKLTEGLKDNFNMDAVRAALNKQKVNQGLTNIVYSVVGGKVDNRGDDDTHASSTEGSGGSLTSAVGSSLIPLVDANEKIGGNIKAEGMASAIGALLVGAVASFNAILNLYNLFKDGQSTNKFSEVKKMGYNLTLATKAGFQAATNIQKYLNGTVGPVASALPGLSIAVSVCETLVSVHKWREAAEIEEALIGDNNKEDKAKKEPIIVDWNNVATNLVSATLNKNPWDSPLFVEDIRGKRSLLDFIWGIEDLGEWSNLNKYKRIDFSHYSTIVHFANGGNIDPANVDHEAVLKLLKPLAGDNPAQIVAYCKLLTKYQLVSKLHEINNKRRIHGSRETGANIISTAGAIMSLIPADGGAAAAIVMGTGAGIKLGLAAGKALQGIRNDAKFLGVSFGKKDEKKNTNQKSKEYFEHAMTILNAFAELSPKNEGLKKFLISSDKKEDIESRKEMLSNKEVSENEIHAFANEHVSANHLLVAAGVDKHDFYYRVKTYNTNSVASLVEFLAGKLGSGR